MDDPLAQQEEILARVASGYGREQLVRTALRLACQYMLQVARYPEDVDEYDLTLTFLQAAEQQLDEAALAEGGEADA